MQAALVSKIIGAGAVIYLIALFTGSQSTTFDSSLLLMMISPLLAVVCIVGLILGAVAFGKSRQKGIRDYSLLVSVFLNALGIIGPFIIPLIQAR